MAVINKFNGTVRLTRFNTSSTVDVDMNEVKLIADRHIYTQIILKSGREIYVREKVDEVIGKVI